MRASVGKQHVDKSTTPNFCKLVDFEECHYLLFNQLLFKMYSIFKLQKVDNVYLCITSAVDLYQLVFSEQIINIFINVIK